MTDKGAQRILDSMIGQKITRVYFEPRAVGLLLFDADIYVEGDWSMISPDGSTEDQSSDIAERSQLHLWRVVDRTVVESSISGDDAPTLTLRLSDNRFVVATASDTPYEDWTVASGLGKIICNGSTITVFSN